ncbi:MAG: NAD(P)/FAD-dependent oxidoreductase [Myxococcales bacterium]
MDFDLAIVGAGVVGLACAERMARAGRRTVLIERHRSFGQETSSRNSEVIHAGIYYPQGSRKARLCVAGNPSLYAWCGSHGVGHARVGKYIVAAAADEEAQLEGILARGRANGVENLAPVARAVLAREEPNVVATAALFSPDTGIVDSHGLMQSLLDAARGSGLEVAFRHALRGVERISGGFSLQLEDPDGQPAAVAAAQVVNAAGLESDAIAARAGIDVDAAGYRLRYVKGRYVRVNRPGFLRHLVYPVPPPSLLGLGVHATVQLDGGIRLGPDTEVLAGRAIDYDVPADVVPRFHAAASRYLRGLREQDLAPDQAGVRPKLGVAGPAADFVIAEESARGLPGWVNLVGIESPGLTCALEIACEVERLLPRP